jgi:hypothetical protein
MRFQGKWDFGLDERVPTSGRVNWVCVPTSTTQGDTVTQVMCARASRPSLRTVTGHGLSAIVDGECYPIRQSLPTDTVKTASAYAWLDSCPSTAVECLIEVVDGSDHRLVRLAGRLAEAQVPELLRVCAVAAVPLQLHLGDLISLDAVGLETLHRLKQRGAVLIEVPTYIQLKLNSVSARRPLRFR